MCFVFFFFKHKTAYELRISDWSSDVCSSDLQRTEALRALADGSATQADLARRFNVSQSTISRLGNKLIPAKAQPPLDSDTERVARVFMSRISGRYAVDRAILFGKIGRASCRERVCQYV